MAYAETRLLELGLSAQLHPCKQPVLGPEAQKIRSEKMMGTLRHFAYSKTKCELWFGQEAPLRAAEGTKEALEGVHSFRTEGICIPHIASIAD